MVAGEGRSMVDGRCSMSEGQFSVLMDFPPIIDHRTSPIDYRFLLKLPWQMLIQECAVKFHVFFGFQQLQIPRRNNDETVFAAF